MNKGFMIICKNCKNHIDIYSNSDFQKAKHGRWSIKIITVNDWNNDEIVCNKCSNKVDNYTKMNNNHLNNFYD